MRRESLPGQVFCGSVWVDGRSHRVLRDDASLLAELRQEIAELRSYGYRSACALVNCQRIANGGLHACSFARRCKGTRLGSSGSRYGRASTAQPACTESGLRANCSRVRAERGKRDFASPGVSKKQSDSS